jgi:hypothetical protein
VRLHCGDRVVERDGRHIGTVAAIFSGSVARVRWLDNGWCSDIALGDVERLALEGGQEH